MQALNNKQVVKASLACLASIFVLGTTSQVNHGGEFLFSPVSVNAQTVSPEDQAQKILGQLVELYPETPLPNHILTAQSPEFLSAATTGQEKDGKFKILYYATENPIDLDDTKVNNLQPLASFEKVTYPDKNQAQEAVNQVIDPNGQEIDLGYGIIGYQNGGAGSLFTYWQEGNWALGVRTPNMENAESIELPYQVVTYLEEHLLPAPRDKGQISLDEGAASDLGVNQIIWQEDNIVYSISHVDPMAAIIMATSITEAAE